MRGYEPLLAKECWLHSYRLLNTEIMALEYTFMWFDVEMFAQRVLQWLELQCRMLPSELLDVFIAFLVPYIWVLCLFICVFFQYEAYVCRIESFQVMAKSVAALGVCDSGWVKWSPAEIAPAKKVLGDLNWPSTHLLTKMTSHLDLLASKKTPICCWCVDFLNKHLQSVWEHTDDQAHSARSQHLTPFCSLLILSPVLQALMCKMLRPSLWWTFHLVLLLFLGPGSCLLPCASAKPPCEVQHRGVGCT